MNKILDFFKTGIITNNPVLVQVIGMCPTLATSTSVENAIGMGIAAAAVLTGSNVVISLLRKFIPNDIRIASYVVIIAGFVTMIEMSMKAYVPALSRSLGLFIPLIVVNCIILARAEAYASKNSVIDSFWDGITMGLGFTFALLILATIREILGNGSWYNIPLFGENFMPATLMILPPGGFLTLGCVIAFIQWITSRKKEGGKA